MGNPETVIRVENLGKKYVIRHGATNGRYQTLRDTIVSGVQSFGRRLFDGPTTATKSCEEFWALKDVSFEVKRGEVVGIIGRNGAGKSTLLKILSRITEPTTGRIQIDGRVASLLEVGTGFHPELTGRENIFLNGAILGMSRAEIKRKFEEIVAFAKVEKFLETPVKRYSSGMYMRLAFSVAAHLEPEILVVDEVLAVGDADFQKKCLGKMSEVARGGRTILFVSHNLVAVQTLCTRSVVLRNGSVMADGPVPQGVGHYLRTIEESASNDLTQRTDRKGIGGVRLRTVRVWSEGAPGDNVLVSGGSIVIEFRWDGLETDVNLVFTIYDQLGGAIANFDTSRRTSEDQVSKDLRGLLRCYIPELPLKPGRYRLNVQLTAAGVVHDHVEAAIMFDVGEGLVFGRTPPRQTAPGQVCIRHYWTDGVDIDSAFKSN